MRSTKPVLLVEDDVVDMMTVRRAFQELNVSNPLIHVSDGERALEYLNDAGQAMPCLVLLDLNMPRMNGVEFIRIAKADPVLREIPIVALTTSNDDRDIVDSYKLGVAGYIVKPVDYRSFVEAIRTIDIYWTISEVPVEGDQMRPAECRARA